MLSSFPPRREAHADSKRHGFCFYFPAAAGSLNIISFLSTFIFFSLLFSNFYFPFYLPSFSFSFLSLLLFLFLSLCLCSSSLSPITYFLSASCFLFFLPLSITFVILCSSYFIFLESGTSLPREYYFHFSRLFLLFSSLSLLFPIFSSPLSLLIFSSLCILFPIFSPPVSLIYNFPFLSLLFSYFLFPPPLIFYLPNLVPPSSPFLLPSPFLPLPPNSLASPSFPCSPSPPPYPSPSSPSFHLRPESGQRLLLGMPLSGGRVHDGQQAPGEGPS